MDISLGAFLADWKFGIKTLFYHKHNCNASLKAKLDIGVITYLLENYIFDKLFVHVLYFIW